MYLTRKTMLILGGLSLLIALAAALILHVDFASLVLYSIAAITGLSMLIAVIYPCVVLFLKERLSPELVTHAKRQAVMSIFVMQVILCGVFQVSLIHHTANLLVVSLAVFCGLLLAVFSFNLKLRLFRIPFVGTLSVIGWFFVVFMLLIGLVHSSPRTVAIGDSMICSQYSWGWGGSEAGGTLDVFKRYLVVDRLVESRTEVWTNPNDQPPTKTETINRCEAAFSRMFEGK